MRADVGRRVCGAAGMTLHTHAAPLPGHQYVWIDANAIGQHEPLRAVWFGLTSWPGRAFGCHVLLECGAVYRNVPLHQLASKPGAPACQVLVEDRSWTTQIEWPTFLRRQSDWHSAEDGE